jgi:phosphotransacetylase
VLNSRTYQRVDEMVEFLYRRLQRRGYLHREIERLVNQDRNMFAALLMQLGEADAMITGVTRPYAQSLREVRRVLDPVTGATPFGIHLLVGQSYTVFLADTTVPSGRPASNWSISPVRRRRWRAAWATNRASPSSPIPPSAIRRAASWIGSARP